MDQQCSAKLHQTKKADSGSVGKIKVEKKTICGEDIEDLEKAFADDFEDYYGEDDVIQLQHDNTVTSDTVVSF